MTPRATGTSLGSSMVPTPIHVGMPDAAAAPASSSPVRSFARPMLRITTCGSVDDGKSTLIGRLLYDCSAVPTDQLDAVVETSRRKGHEQVDLALLTDGLRAEREQGITIDVAYRYFDAPSRRIIIADAPGHEQYTRNMATAASVADLAIVLIDARLGVSIQTRRHTLIAAMLRVPIVVFAINKCDLINYDQSTIDHITTDALALANSLGVGAPHIVPISALRGENVAHRCDQMPFYTGPILLDILDAAAPQAVESDALRFPVQHVIRPRSDAHHDYRGYAGTVLSGSIRPGDRLRALPSGLESRVRDIHLGERSLEVASPGDAVAITLESDLDIPRGEMLVHAAAQPAQRAPVVADRLEADVVWMDARPLVPGTRLLLKHTTRQVKAVVESITHRVDPVSLDRAPASELGLNDIGRVVIQAAGPIVCDLYAQSRHTGALVLISDQTGNTLAAGMIQNAIADDPANPANPANPADA